MKREIEFSNAILASDLKIGHLIKGEVDERIVTVNWISKRRERGIVLVRASDSSWHQYLTTARVNVYRYTR